MNLEARYELLEKIGSGSFATVYRARDLELGREVAIKKIHEQYLEDPAPLERFWQEAQLLASLSHPNVVTIYDVHRERGWLILELMQASLAERFADRQMPIASVRTTLAHGLRALKYLGSRGIVHGDVKLSNLMIDSRRRIKIGDFGLARRVSDEDGSLIKGTTKYMAPEVVSEEFGEIGPASDLYSLGFCAYELMCGSNFETLFPGLSAFGRNKQIAWMMWHAAADRRLPPIARVLEGVPDDLATVIERLIAKDQTQRYRTADEALSQLKIDLKLVKSDDPDALDAAENAEDQAQKKRLLVAGGALAISLILCLVILFFPSAPPPEPPQTVVRLVSAIYPGENRLKVEDLERTFADELSLGENPRIFLTNTNQNIVPRELQTGDRIEIETTTDEAGRARLVITASRPIQSQGVVREIDRALNRILVAVDQGTVREDLRLRVPERAEVLTQTAGKSVPGHLRDLNVGDLVSVTHLDELGDKPGRFVVRLSITKLEQGVGFVSHVDAERRRLIVTYGLNQNDGRLNLPLAKNCPITLESQEIALADLQPNDRVRFRHDHTEFQQLTVLRDQTLAHAVILGVDLDKRELRVTDAQGKPLTFLLPEDCEITLAREPALLSDLRPYDVVDLTWREMDQRPEASSVLVVSRRVDHQRVALLIGLENYQDEALTPLTYSIANVERLHQRLVNRYAFHPDRIERLQNPDRQELQERTAKFLSEIGRNVQVITYFCGHAYRAGENEYVLAPKNFHWDRRAETGVPVQWLIDEMEKCPSQNKLLLLDVCHPGSGTDLEYQPAPETLLNALLKPPSTTTIIGNCQNGERGLAIEDGQHSLFAYEIGQGFGGAADANRDLMITADELFAHLKPALATAAKGVGKTQTPVRVGKGAK